MRLEYLNASSFLQNKKLIKKILYSFLKREDSFSVLLLKLLGGALFFLLFPITTYCQDFDAHENEDNGIIVIGDAKIITHENTSLKESYTENISKEVSNQTTLKDEAKVVVKEKTIKNSLAQTKKINAKKYKNIEEKINSKIVFNHNSKSEGNFSFSSYFYKIANNSNNNTVGKFTNIEIGLSISYLFVYQNRQNVLYEFYNSTNSKNYLFTRPPPSFY